MTRILPFALFVGVAACRTPVEKMGFVELDTPLADRDGQVLVGTEFAPGERFRFQALYARENPLCLASYTTNELSREYGFEVTGQAAGGGVTADGKAQAVVHSEWVLQELMHCGSPRFRVGSVNDFDFASGAPVLGERKVVVGLLIARKFKFHGSISGTGALEVQPPGTTPVEGDVKYHDKRRREGESLVIGVKVDRLMLRRVASADLMIDERRPSASPIRGAVEFATLRWAKGGLTLESLRMKGATVHRTGAAPQEMGADSLTFPPPSGGGFYLIDYKGEEFEYARLTPSTGGWRVQLYRYRFVRE